MINVSLLVVALAISITQSRGQQSVSNPALSVNDLSESLSPPLAESQQDGNWRPAPVDGWRGRYSHYDEETRVRSEFMTKLIQKGVGVGTSEVTAMAMGEDEVQNLPPAMVAHLITALLHIETVYKKSQMYLSSLDGSIQFLVSTALPAEQMKMTFTVQALLAPVGILYGNDAIVKRIGQALSLFFQRQLSEPFPWTFTVQSDSRDGQASQSLDAARFLGRELNRMADADTL